MTPAALTIGLPLASRFYTTKTQSRIGDPILHQWWERCRQTRFDLSVGKQSEALTMFDENQIRAC